MRTPGTGLSRRAFAGSLIALPLWPQPESLRIENVTAEGAVNNPYGLRTGPDSDLYICEIGNHRISKIDLKSQKLTSVIDGQKEPYDLRFDDNGVLYFVDMPAHQVRSFDMKTGKLAVVAGTGTSGFTGDGGPAVNAQFKQPHSIAFDQRGRLLVCDIGNHRIRMVDRQSGIITTFAGTGEQGATPEGASRKDTALNGPRSIDSDSSGNLYIVLRDGNRVYRLNSKSDTFELVAGTGEKGYTGDGGDARLARLSGPKAICCSPEGSIYIADTESHTIRRISPKGIISTIAGTGERGDGPVGDPRKCKLSRPHGVFLDSAGTIFICDSEANRVRKIVQRAG